MQAQADIFDPRHYGKVEEPIERCESLPSWCFTSERFYAAEQDRIFMKAWVFIGRVDELPNPNDYLTMNIAGESVIVMRDRKGGLAAFSNSCMHRGAMLLEGRGNKRSIICPYHMWTYGTDGNLLDARLMERTEGFDKGDYGLQGIRLETWEGFMFINFDAGAPSLLEYLGDLPEKFASYRFSEMIVTRRVEYALECNWKIYAENSTECYHTPMVHGASLGEQHDTAVETRGNWAAIHVPGETTIAVLPGETTDLPHIEGLEGPCKTGTHFALVYPLVTLCCTQDCMWWLAYYPETPHTSTLRVGMCFPKSTTELPQFAKTVQKYYHRWDTGAREDNAITAVQQRGLRGSRRRPPGRMSFDEPVVHELAKWVKQRVIG
jgi:choline monooxygenase